MDVPQYKTKKMLKINKDAFKATELSFKHMEQINTTKEKNHNVSDSLQTSIHVYKGQILSLLAPSSTSSQTTTKLQFINMQTEAHRQVNLKPLVKIHHVRLSAMINQQIYVFDGKDEQSKNVNYLWKINAFNGLVEEQDVIGNTVPIRQHGLIQSINNSFILIYGGLNTYSNVVLQDASIWNNDRTTSLTIMMPINQRLNFAYTKINNKILLHGGKTQIQKQLTYLNDFYEIKVNEATKQLTFYQIHSKGISPQARSNHSITNVSDRLVLLMGGENMQIDMVKKLQKTQNKTNKTKNTLNDCWIFDINQNCWSQIKFEGFNYVARLNSQIKNYKNKIIIFGGQDSYGTSKQIVQTFQFPKVKQIFPIHSQQFHLQKLQSPFLLSTNLIHSTSYSISFSFQSIQKVIQYAELLQSTRIRIFSQATCGTFDRYAFISFQFDGMLNLKDSKHKQNRNNHQHTNHMILQQFRNLPIYCLRFGKNMLYVQNCDETGQRNVLFVSTDTKYTPLTDKNFLSYQYNQNFHSGIVSSEQSQRNKKIVYQILATIIADPNLLISNVKNSKIMIFFPNIIPVSKTYYYQLIFDPNTDVSLFKNTKKVEQLQKIGYSINSCMQFSLKNYVKYIKSNMAQLNVQLSAKQLNIKQSNAKQSNKKQSNAKQSNENLKSISKQQNPTQIYINYIPQPIHCPTYLAYLQSLSESQKLVHLFINPKTIKHITFIKVFMCKPQFILPDNNGILLYVNGRLINRYQCPFGKLIRDHFFHKKYINRPKNVFQIVGEVHLTQQLELVNFRTDFGNTRKYCLFKASFEKQLSIAVYKAKNQIKLNDSLPEKLHLNVTQSSSNHLKHQPSDQQVQQVHFQGSNQVIKLLSVQGKKKVKLNIEE